MSSAVAETNNLVGGGRATPVQQKMSNSPSRAGAKTKRKPRTSPRLKLKNKNKKKKTTDKKQQQQQPPSKNIMDMFKRASNKEEEEKKKKKNEEEKNQKQQQQQHQQQTEAQAKEEEKIEEASKRKAPEQDQAPKDQPQKNQQPEQQTQQAPAKKAKVGNDDHMDVDTKQQEQEQPQQEGLGFIPGVDIYSGNQQDFVNDYESDEEFEAGHEEVALPTNLDVSQQQTIQDRMAAMREKFAAAQEAEKKKKLSDVLNVCNQVGPQYKVTEEQAQVMLDLCNDDELQTIEKITSTDGSFIVIAQEMCPTEPEPAAAGTNADADTDTDEEKGGDKTTETTFVKHQKTHTVKAKRILLNDALKKKTEDGTIDTSEWSDARKKAWKLKDERPNSYYYRFNEPGQPQRNGAWSEAEKKLFEERKTEIGINQQWGIFSMTIPGRVGYQCSNYYRKCIKDGTYVDENYIIDDGGKLRFKFKKKGFERSASRTSKPKPKKKKTPKPKPAPKQKRKAKPKKKLGRFAAKPRDNVARNKDNPIPNYIDSITMDPIIQPALSPFGHVLGYETWCRLLLREPKNTCPFTKKVLTRRQLTKLTKANIDEYSEKMIGFDKMQVVKEEHKPATTISKASNDDDDEQNDDDQHDDVSKVTESSSDAVFSPDAAAESIGSSPMEEE